MIRALFLGKLGRGVSSFSIITGGVYPPRIAMATRPNMAEIGSLEEKLSNILTRNQDCGCSKAPRTRMRLFWKHTRQVYETLTYVAIRTGGVATKDSAKQL
jgi:hypothetical protein